MSYAALKLEELDGVDKEIARCELRQSMLDFEVVLVHERELLSEFKRDLERAKRYYDDYRSRPIEADEFRRKMNEEYTTRYYYKVEFLTPIVQKLEEKLAYYQQKRMKIIHKLAGLDDLR